MAELQNLVLVLGVVGIGWWGWSALHPAPAKSVAQTAVASIGDVSSSVSASGKVVSPGDIGVSPLSSAQITSIRVKVGDHVGAGAIMATLDSTSAATALKSARAALASDQIKFTQDTNAISTAKQTNEIHEAQLQVCQLNKHFGERLQCKTKVT